MFSFVYFYACYSNQVQWIIHISFIQRIPLGKEMYWFASVIENQISIKFRTSELLKFEKISKLEKNTHNYYRWIYLKYLIFLYKSSQQDKRWDWWSQLLKH